MKVGPFFLKARSAPWGGWLFAGSLLIGNPAVSHALGLMDVFNAAKTHDLDYLSAQSDYQAGQTRASQSSALWRPSVSASATSGRMTSTNQMQGAQFSAPGFPMTDNAAFNTSINNGNLERWALTARQPLVSGERLAQGRELDIQSQVAELDWQIARETLFLHVVQRYFEVALAQEALDVTRHQLQAAERTLDEVKSRYKLGGNPVTDIHEAQARRDAIRAQVMADESDLQLKQAALSDATGIGMGNISAYLPVRGSLPEAGNTLDQWDSDVISGNPSLRKQLLGVDVAREEVRRYSAWASPSLDLVGEVAQDRLSGTGDYGAASNVMRTTLVGIQLTVPLYSGGMRSSKQSEQEHLADKALTDSDRLRQQVLLETRSAWLGLSTGAQRVEALFQAMQAGEERLKATRLGHEVGDRSTLQLLDAENDAAASRLSWAQARVAVTMNWLQLEALAGKLDENQLRRVDGLLDRNNTINPK